MGNGIFSDKYAGDDFCRHLFPKDARHLPQDAEKIVIIRETEE